PVKDQDIVAVQLVAVDLDVVYFLVQINGSRGVVHHPARGKGCEPLVQRPGAVNHVALHLVCRLSGAAPPVPGGSESSAGGTGLVGLQQRPHHNALFVVIYLVAGGCVVHGNPTARPASGIVVVHIDAVGIGVDGVAFNKSIADIPLQADAGIGIAVQQVVADDDVAGGVMAAVIAVARHRNAVVVVADFVAGNQYVAGAGDEDAAGPPALVSPDMSRNSIPDDLAGGAPADLNAVLRPAGMDNCPHIVVELNGVGLGEISPGTDDNAAAAKPADAVCLDEHVAGSVDHDAESFLGQIEIVYGVFD